MQQRMVDNCSNALEMITSHTQRNVILGIRTSVPVLVRGRSLFCCRYFGFQPKVTFLNSYECMEFAACIDESDAYDPIRRCECQMGKIFDDSGEVCVDPPPPSSTPRPIPTMPPDLKAVVRGMQKTASTLLIIFVSITLALFAILRISNTGR